MSGKVLLFFCLFHSCCTFRLGFEIYGSVFNGKRSLEFPISKVSVRSGSFPELEQDDQLWKPTPGMVHHAQEPEN